MVFEPPLADIRTTPPLTQIVADLEKQGIIVALRQGRLRASPHFYNTEAQIDRLIDALP